MARRWVLPLAALSEIADFNHTSIPGESHYQTTIDTYSQVWPWRSYKTSLHTPPHMNITRYDGRLEDGYVFLAPADSKSEMGTYEVSGTGFIMTMEGDMIYAGEERGYSFCDEWVAGMTDFRSQYYNGRPYITYWNGCNTQGAHWGHRWGRVTFVDQEYNNFTVSPDLDINTLDDANEGQIDLHEHDMTADGTMVVSSYNNTLEDLSMFNASKETWVAESMFFEIDIKTGKVLFQWRAMDHIPLKNSHWALNENRGTHHVPWDWFHINSVQKVGKNYLVSARHLWAIYLISGEDGSVIWKLGGVDGGDFGSIPSRFRWQHHARAQNVTEHGMTISVFNNHVNGRKNEHTQSQALAFYLTLPPNPDNPPQLIRRLQTKDDLAFSATMGSYQLNIGHGNGFVGYGKVPLAREYGPASDGSDLRWQARFGHDGAVINYRTFKIDWHGTPANWDPVALFEAVPLQHSIPAKVYVSWNGATGISDWAVYAGDDREHLKPIGVVRKMGFETTFTLSHAQCVQLGAIREGKIIRASNVACQDDAPAVGAGSRPSKIDGGFDISDLQEADLEDLKEQVGELVSGVWVSYSLVAEVACAVVAMGVATSGYLFWRDRRRRKEYHVVLGNEPYSSESRLGAGLGLGVFNTAKDKMKLSPMVSNGSAEFEEWKLDGAAASRRRRGTMDDEPFDLADADTDEDEDDNAANPRMPFMRQNTMNS